jgi:Tfp pilus assembly protein PilE
MFCNKCGSQNPDDASFCSACGFALGKAKALASIRSQSLVMDGTPEASRKTASTSVQPTSRKFDQEAYAAAIGPKNTAYYLERFKQFHSGNYPITWHWPGFLATSYWLIYRKHWLHAVLYTLFSYFLGAAIGFIEAANKDLTLLAWLLFFLMLFIVPGLYANRLHYNRCTELIRKFSVHTCTREEQLIKITKNGGTSKAGKIIIVLFFVILFIGIIAGISIPSYQAYIIRAKSSEAISVTRQAAAAVESFYISNGRLPANLGAAGYAGRLPSNVLEISLNTSNGIISTAFSIAPNIHGTILFTPTQQNDRSITWTCSGLNLDQQHLPVSCRK